MELWQRIIGFLSSGQNVRSTVADALPPLPVLRQRPAAPAIIKAEYASPHFKWAELQCKGDCKDCPYALEAGGPVRNVSDAAIEKNEALRVLIGAAYSPNSCCRCPIHNRKEGGKSRSQHISTASQPATAFDIPLVVPKARLIEAAVEVGFGGIGVNYNSFVHMDDRGYRARW